MILTGLAGKLTNNAQDMGPDDRPRDARTADTLASLVL